MQQNIHIACISRNNGITAHSTVPFFALLRLSEDSSGFFVLAGENPTPAGRVRFIKWGNICPCILKIRLFFLPCSAFVFCLHVCSLSQATFSHVYFPVSSRMEQGVREERWSVSESQHLICEGGFSSLVVRGLLPWHDAMGSLSPGRVL